METFIFRIIIALVFGLVCGLVARKKNRSVTGWAIFGVFLPALAIIIILCLKRKMTWAENPEFEDLPCPYCNVKIGGRSIFCPKCGKQLRKGVIDQSEVKSSNKSE